MEISYGGIACCDVTFNSKLQRNLINIERRSQPLSTCNPQCNPNKRWIMERMHRNVSMVTQSSAIKTSKNIQMSLGPCKVSLFCEDERWRWLAHNGEIIKKGNINQLDDESGGITSQNKIQEESKSSNNGQWWATLNFHTRIQTVPDAGCYKFQIMNGSYTRLCFVFVFVFCYSSNIG